MPLWLRKTLTVLSFAMFFGSGIVLGLVVMPLLWLVAWRPERYRRLATRLLGRTYPGFLHWMRFANLIVYDPIALPPDLPKDRPYLLVANHPTIIDVIFCLAWFPRLTSIVKASHYRGLVFGPLLRATEYIPGPGMPGDDDPDAELPPPLERMVKQLEGGHSLVVFPEGTRSPPDTMLRFQRGPFEAAVRAKAIVLPLFIGVDNPGLTKGIPLQSGKMTFTFEWLPFTDCAAEDVGSLELRNRTYRLFKARWDRYIDVRDRVRRRRREEANARVTA
jgi:1-acyl-sn-glycerol-3-phosphate acyltransferase